MKENSCVAPELVSICKELKAIKVKENGRRERIEDQRLSLGALQDSQQSWTLKKNVSCIHVNISSSHIVKSKKKHVEPRVVAMSVIPAPQRLKQEDQCELKVSLRYM